MVRQSAFDIICRGSDRPLKNFDFADNFVLMCMLFPTNKVVMGGEPFYEEELCSATLPKKSSLPAATVKCWRCGEKLL